MDDRGLIGRELNERLDDAGEAADDPTLTTTVIDLVEAMAERTLVAERELAAVKVAGRPCDEAKCYRAAGHDGAHEDIASRWTAAFPFNRRSTNG